MGEQLGLVGATPVLGLLPCRLAVPAVGPLARDSLAASSPGFFTFVAFSIFQNAGMTMGIMPITGIPLPLVSYGGTAALCFFTWIGVVLGVFGPRPAEVGGRGATPPSGGAPPSGSWTSSVTSWSSPTSSRSSPSKRSEAPLRELSFRVGVARAWRSLRAAAVGVPPAAHPRAVVTVLRPSGHWWRPPTDRAPGDLPGRARSHVARGREVMDCRPTDGITIALRQLCRRRSWPTSGCCSLEATWSPGARPSAARHPAAPQAMGVGEGGPVTRASYSPGWLTPMACSAGVVVPPRRRSASRAR